MTGCEATHNLHQHSTLLYLSLNNNDIDDDGNNNDDDDGNDNFDDDNDNDDVDDGNTDKIWIQQQENILPLPMDMACGVSS